MGFKCCVVGCYTGYATNKCAAKVSVFRFPQDQCLRDKWLRNIHTANHTITKHSRVCELHFRPDDFITETEDSHATRIKNREEKMLKLKRLKGTAYPSVFPNLPMYLTEKEKPIRGSKSSVSARAKNQNLRFSELEKEVFENEKLTDFSTLKSKIDDIYKGKFTLWISDGCVTFCYLKMVVQRPELLGSLKINSDLTFSAWVHKSPVPENKFSHLLSDKEKKHLKVTTEVSNVLSALNGMIENFTYETIKDLIIASLKEFLLVCDHEHVALIKFIIEQLKLLSTSKYAHRFSSDLTLLAYFWQMSSPSLYKKLADFFFLPSIRRLQDLSRGMSVKENITDGQYIEMRLKDSGYSRRVVALLIDEIYTAKRVEYRDGKFVGLTDEGKVAKTVLAFMVKSLSCKFKEIVCLVPQDTLTVSLLRSNFDKVMLEISKYFDVVAILSDNNAVNR